MLKIDPSIVVVFIIVWILVVVLTKTVFNPVRRVINDRNRRIKTDREAGEDAVQAYQSNLKKIEDDIKQAKASAFSIRDTLEKEAAKERERMLSEVSRACRERVDQARQELDRQVQDLKSELSRESERLAEKIEERLLP
jgi:F-type H+-transporting ATPase subunit b